MHRKNFFFVAFEGIEGSGKSYLSRKLYQKIKRKKLPVIFTREPGGSKSAEKIRKIILTGSKNKFTIMTDTLLYLAARNEHFEKKIRPAIIKKKIIICDRFYDSTLAYQVYGKGVSKSLVDNVHDHLLGKFKPNLTFVLKVNINKALKRLSTRRQKRNRYDNFSKKFYTKVQKAFIKIAKRNKKKYIILDNSLDSKEIEKIILKNFMKRYH